MAARRVTYRPRERTQLGYLGEALGAGLTPDVGAQMLSGIEQGAAQRLAELEARRQAQAQAAQAAQGQLGQLAISSLQSNPDLTQEQLSGIVGAQQAALGLPDKVAARVDTTGVLGALYPGGTSVFAQPVALSEQEKAALGDEVGQILSKAPHGTENWSLQNAIDTKAKLLAASGADPDYVQAVRDQMEQAYQSLTGSSYVPGNDAYSLAQSGFQSVFAPRGPYDTGTMPALLGALAPRAAYEASHPSVSESIRTYYNPPKRPQAPPRG